MCLYINKTLLTRYYVNSKIFQYLLDFSLYKQVILLTYCRRQEEITNSFLRQADETLTPLITDDVGWHRILLFLSVLAVVFI